MSYQCNLCLIDPSSHSLTKIKETNDIVYFYTCPSQAKLYYDVNSILEHYNGVLSEIPSNKQWIWIFDSINFDFKHFININVGIELAKLITNKFSSNLKNIIIINPTFYTSATYNIIKTFLNSHILSIIELNNTITTYNDLLYFI
jgi:hypothetical protein